MDDKEVLEAYVDHGAFPDPVFGSGTTWFFWDETWAFYHGPYGSESEARDALNRYCIEVLG